MACVGAQGDEVSQSLLPACSRASQWTEPTRETPAKKWRAWFLPLDARCPSPHYRATIRSSANTKVDSHPCSTAHAAEHGQLTRILLLMPLWSVEHVTSGTSFYFVRFVLRHIICEYCVPHCRATRWYQQLAFTAALLAKRHFRCHSKIYICDQPAQRKSEQSKQSKLFIGVQAIEVHKVETPAAHRGTWGFKS